MPKAGEVRRGREIGRDNRPTSKFTWSVCPSCQRGKWLDYYYVLHYKKGSSCLSCTAKEKGFAKKIGNVSGMNHPSWKGGRQVQPSGYVIVWLSPDNPFYQMATKKGYVMEHRLIVAERLGRCLLRAEKVHHINGIRDDNRDENLKLVSQRDHSVYTHLCRNCELRKEIRLLRWQVKELTAALQERLKL